MNQGDVLQAAEELQVSVHAARLEIDEAFALFERRVWALTQRTRKLRTAHLRAIKDAAGALTPAA